MFDLVIVNGTLITTEATIQADLGIRGERIAAIGTRLAGLEAIDATGMLVLPGAVDEHVHLQMPVGEFTSSDDFYTGTVAAAWGGTTSIVDFAEPRPGQPLLEALAQRRAEADGKVAVDYGLHMTLSRSDQDTLAQVAACIDAGASSFKLYMAYEGLRLDDGGVLRALAALREHGGRALVHAENHDAIVYLTALALVEGRTGPENHPLTRPAVMEAEAIHRLLALAHTTGTPLVLAHLSCELGRSGRPVGRPGDARSRNGRHRSLSVLLRDSENPRPRRFLAHPRRSTGHRNTAGVAVHLRGANRTADLAAMGRGLLHGTGPPLRTDPGQGNPDRGRRCRRGDI
jgi:dihydroorotase-like cyclic amidohydrolase